MESIAVTKPDMTVTRQDALSPFGLLTALFTEEIARRNSRSTGFYRAMPLAYLEESEREALPSPPEVRIELNIDLLLNRLLKDAREKEKNEKKPQTPPERILERVVVREHELRTAYAETRRVVIETGGKRYTAHMPVKASAQDPEYTKRNSADREAQSKESSPAAADMQKRAGSPSKLLSAAGTAKPVPAWTTAEQKRPDRTLPLASRMMSAPAAGGWTPQQRELHPGYPVRSETKQAGGIPAGSILLPDVLRRRREEAIAQSEIRRVSADVSEAYDAANDALEWSTEGAEKNFETDRILREVRRAVDKTLRRNALRGNETPTQPEKRGEHRETRSYAAGSERERDDSYTRARAHASGAQEKSPGHEAGSVPDTQTFAASTSETERTAEHAASAQSADGRFASQNRGTAAAPRDMTAEPSEQPAAHEQEYNQPALSVDTAEPEERIPFAAFPEGEETDVPPELIFREDAKGDIHFAAKRKGGKAPAPQTAVGTEASSAVQGKPETALPIEGRSELPEEAPAELTYRTDGEPVSAARREGGKAPAPQTAVETEAPRTAKMKQETALPTESRSELPEEAPAELTYRTAGEPISAEKRERGKAPAPQTAVGAAKVRPETTLPIEGRAELPEEAPAELTYRTDGEPISAAKREDGKAPAPQTAVETEAPGAAKVRPETALPIESRAELPEEAPAELTYHTDGKPISAAEREGRKAPVPQTAVGTEASSAVQGKPETALPIESREELTEEAPAELAYRTDGEPISAAKRENGKAPAAQTAAGTETQRAAKVRPETALPTESRAELTEEAPTELIYREDTEQTAGQSTEQANPPGDGPAERGTDVRTQVTVRPDAAIPAAIPSDPLETEIPAELTYREQAEESIRQNAERSETKAPVPQSPIRTETEPTAHVEPETAILTAIPTARGETNVSAELTYRADTEQNAGQSELRRTDGTTGRQTPAQQFIPAVIRHGEAHSVQPQTKDAPRARKTAGQTVRDIRVASEQGRRRTDAVRGERRNAEETEQVVQKGQDADRVALPVGEETDALRPPELFFAAPASAEQPPEDPMKARPATPPQSDRTNELPTWAKELLDKSGVSQTEQRTAALNWKSGVPGTSQVNWTAPAAVPQNVPTDRTELSFKKTRETEELPAHQPISDAEIQRTADRVYKIIEERIRRELRRSGR